MNSKWIRTLRWVLCASPLVILLIGGTANWPNH